MIASLIDQADWQKTAIRMPRDMHAAVHAAARVSGRSYNAEIVHL